MGQVVIKFIGLCIHIQKKDFPSLPAQHRVILLSDPRREMIEGKHIKPHIPLIYFREPPQIRVPCLEAQGPNAFRLKGVRMRITNGKNRLVRHESYERIPHLTQPGDHLEAKDDVILDGAAPAVAYFDTDHGVLAACLATPKGAVGTNLTIDTGDEDPLLELSCFGTQSIKLATNAVLEIVNMAEHGRDDDHDYLLNYDVVKTIPANLKPPHPDVTGLEYCTVLAEIDLDFGPPCSNSNYP